MVARRPSARRAALVLSALAALGACARSDGDRPDAAGQVSAQWLVGGWVLKGEACDSDGGVIYRPDGSWHSSGAAGSWSMDRGSLTFLVTEQEDDQGRSTRVNPPVRHVEQVRIVGPNEYIATRAPGDQRALVRSR
jgi:hypothetical protein